MTRDEMAAIVGRRAEAWNSRNPAAFIADFAQDAVVDSPTGGKTAGKVAIKALFRNWLNAFPDLEWVCESYLIDGNRAAVDFRITGTHGGTFLGVAATGRRFSIRGVTLLTVRKGKIVHERRIYDYTGFLVQLGALQPFSE